MQIVRNKQRGDETWNAKHLAGYAVGRAIARYSSRCRKAVGGEARENNNESPGWGYCHACEIVRPINRDDDSHASSGSVGTK